MGSSSVIRRKKGGEKSSTEADDAAGLRIVIVEVDEYSTTVVVKSGLKALTNKPIISSFNYYSAPSSLITGNGFFNCFLKSCHLCKKPLSPDKDVYMYRGDQGFCSIACRSRQIMVDEMKEDEKRERRLKDAAAPTIECAGCETSRLLEDLRKHRKIRNTTKYEPANNALISPTKHRQPLLSFS